jgi:hypothetical protein
VWTARKRDTGPGKPPQFSFTREQRRVSVLYVYIWDAAMGSGFIKVCTYFPYPLKVWVNGHEWAKRQALAAGLSFSELSNGFASGEDPAGLQDICDRFGSGHVHAWSERWMSRLPLPLTSADRDAGFWRELSMRQIETSRTVVFDDDVHARAFFEALLCENMDLGRPENVGLLFRRGQRYGRPSGPPPGGGFKTKIDRRCDLVTLNVFYKSSARSSTSKTASRCASRPSSTAPRTCAATASCRISTNCRTRRVQSTPACWKLKQSVVSVVSRRSHSRGLRCVAAPWPAATTAHRARALDGAV